MPVLPEQPDGDLLSLYLVGRNQEVFAAIVERHEAMVMGVCRRVLRNGQDAEDASQGTFLLFLRKAATIHDGEALESWLRGTAYRVANDARKSKRRRQVHESSYDDSLLTRLTQVHNEDDFQELQALLGEELDHVPEQYREPFVLCCLEGMSKRAAAQKLGWPEGTVSSRLAKARKLLQRRLAVRGVTPSAR